jgi:hypothetical protein
MQTRQQMENEIDSVIKGYNALRRDRMEKALSGFDGGNEMLRMARTIQPGMRKGSFLAQATGEIKPFDAAASGPGDLLASRTAPAEQFGEMLHAMYPDLTNIARPTAEPSPWDLPDSWTLLEERARSTGKAIKKEIAALAAPLHARGWVEHGLDSPTASATAVSYKNQDFPGHVITMNFTNGKWDHQYYGDSVASGTGPEVLNNWLAEFSSNEGQFGSKKVGVGSRLTKAASMPSSLS